jgi:hypothetical protein
MDVETSSGEHGVRMHVNHPSEDEWRERHGNDWPLQADRQRRPDNITLMARHSGSYSGDDGREALGYHAMLSADGDAYFKKKLYHGDGGYNTDKFEAEENAVDDVKDEWIGVKSMTYNIEHNRVKLELWVDDRQEENNNWEKAAEYIPTRATLKSMETATAAETRGLYHRRGPAARNVQACRFRV